MTTKEIQIAVAKDRVLSGHTCVAENISHLLNYEIDVMSMTTSGYLCEYEVKISRSDFKADKKKKKSSYFLLKMNKCIPNYFYYVVPDGLIDVKEIPDYAGLWYMKDGGIVEIKKASLIHKHKHDANWINAKLVKVYEQRTYLGSCMLTYKNNQITEKYRNRNQAQIVESKNKT